MGRLGCFVAEGDRSASERNGEVYERALDRRDELGYFAM
jgi:hypothetical protein